MKRARSEAGLSQDGLSLVPGPLLPEFAYQILCSLEADRPKAVVCFNDDQAGGAYRRRGRRGCRWGMTCR